MVVGVMGISMEQLIDMIRENRDGRFDCLFKETAANQAKLEAPV